MQFTTRGASNIAKNSCTYTQVSERDTDQHEGTRKRGSNRKPSKQRGDEQRMGAGGNEGPGQSGNSRTGT